LLITRADGLVDTAQAAELCHVGESTIRAWVCRGALEKAGMDERGRSLFEPVAVARAERKTRKRARREFTSQALAA
jgi:DNA-binding transcriptional MerR regulator